MNTAKNRACLMKTLLKRAGGWRNKIKSTLRSVAGEGTDHSVAANGWKEQQPGEPIVRLLGSGCQDESRANEKLCSIAEMHVPERGAKGRRLRSEIRWDEKAGLRRDAGALPSYRRALRHKR